MPLPEDPLTLAPIPAGAGALVLMLHGGAEHGHREVDGRSLAWRRTRAMSSAIAPRLAEAGLGCALLRFSVKGWNAGAGGPSPVPDARAAVARLRDRHGIGLVLLGHSMGARTAARVADEEGVLGVVGLAPWFPADDPVAALRGRHLIAAHGRADRITRFDHTERFVERALPVAASAQLIDMGPLGHYMLRGARRWNEIAANAVMAVAEGRPERLRAPSG